MFESTVTELIAATRQRANMENTSFVTDDEILYLLNRAHTELYDAVVQTYEEYFLESVSVPIVSGTDTYSLPDNFYKVLGVDLSIDAERAISLKRFVFTERNKYKTTIYAPHIPASIYLYAVQGMNLKLIPSPKENRNATLWFVPLPKKLVISNPGTNETDYVDIRLAMYDDYLVLDSAINIMLKEESNPAAYISERDGYMDSVIKSAANRDTNEPGRVTDVYSANYPSLSGISPW